MKKLEGELPNDAMCYFEQILEAAPYKTATVRSLTSHLENHPSKNKFINEILLWTPTHGYNSVGQLASLEDLPIRMEGKRES